MLLMQFVFSQLEMINIGAESRKKSINGKIQFFKWLVNWLVNG